LAHFKADPPWKLCTTHAPGEPESATMTGDPDSPLPAVKRELEADGAELQAAEAPALDEGVKAEADSTRRRLGKKTRATPANGSKRSGKRRLRNKGKSTARVKTISTVKMELKQRAGKASAPSRRFRLRRKAVTAKPRPDPLAKAEVKAELREQQEEEPGEPAEEEKQRGKKAKQELGTQRRGSTAREKAPASRRRRGSIKGEVKLEPQEIPSFEERLPFFLAQCKAFQLAKRTWRVSRPCCLANCILDPRVHFREGQACYERLNKEQKKRFKRLVDAPDVEAKASRGQVSMRTFTLLLHPERAPIISVRRKSLNAESEPDEVAGPTDAFGGEGRSVARAVARAKARQERLERQANRDGRKRSGVRGVFWCPASDAWMATWTYPDEERGVQVFKVRDYMGYGRSREDAEKEALREAIVFRERLFVEGKIKGIEDNENKGLTWNKRRKGWDVCFRVHGQKLRGGYFRPLDDTPEAIEKARQAAAECRKQLELKHGRYGQQIQQAILHQGPGGQAPGEASRQEPALKAPKQQREESGRKVPMRGSSAAAFTAPATPAAGRRRKDSQVGVTWRRHGCHWRVHMYVNGKLDRRLFKPKEDGTPEEVERELLAACRVDARQGSRT